MEEMDLNWQRFDDGILSGMEAFYKDNLSVHIVSYQQGQGFHWLIREWDSNDNCEATLSWNDPEVADGWEFLSEAYCDLIDELEERGIITPFEAEAAQEPSVIKNFLQKAAQIGLAVMFSFSAVAGSGIFNPDTAYAYSGDDGTSITVEFSYGQLSIISAENHNDTIYMGSIESQYNFNLDEAGPMYQMVMDAVDNGGIEADSIVDCYVGNVEGGDFSVITADGTAVELTQAQLDILKQEYNDDVMHQCTIYKMNEDFTNKIMETKHCQSLFKEVQAVRDYRAERNEEARQSHIMFAQTGLFTCLSIAGIAFWRWARR